MDPKRLGLPADAAWDGKPPSPKRPPRHKKGERFLKGPIPWDWVKRAAGLPGKAVHVALALWFRAGISKDRTVRLSYSELAELHCKKEAARRALAALENADLVSVDRHPGRCPIVTIQEAEETVDDAPD